MNGPFRTAHGQLTVAELIEQLREMPEDAPAMVSPEMGPGQAASARSVIFEHGHVWITGRGRRRPAPTACEACGCSYEECTRRVHTGRSACCRACYVTDRHGMSAAGVL